MQQELSGPTIFLLSVDNGEEEYLSLFWREQDILPILAEKLDEAGFPQPPEFAKLDLKKALKKANGLSEELWVDVVEMEVEGSVDQELINQLLASIPKLTAIQGGKA